MSVEYLKWDSQFFNKKIGKIIIKDESLGIVSSLLEESCYENYKLIYLFSPEYLLLENDTLKRFNGKLVDKKIVYRLDFQFDSCQSNKVEEYTSSKLINELEKLAYLSGTFSRYLTDKNFATADFYKLYHIWIKKSIHKELADKLFVVRESKKIVGMVTLKKEKNIGKIGLIATFEDFHGKGYGRQLIEACKKSLKDDLIYVLEVTTQTANQQACLFYEKCRFSKISITNVYHFWLND